MKAFGTKTKTGDIMTWILMGVWVFLISFAFVAAADPGWLRGISKFGISGESRGIKDYADALLRQKRYSEAIAQYERALQIRPDFIGARVNLAICYNVSGNTDMALKVLSDALQTTSERNGSIYFNIAEILERKGKIAEAIDYYRKAIGSEIEQELVYQRLAKVYMDDKQFDNARDAFEKTLAIQTDPMTPYQNMLRRYLYIYEENPDEYRTIENLLDQNSVNTRLAAYDLQVIENLNANNREIAKTHNHLAVIYIVQNNYDKAIEHFEQSLKIWPGNEDAVRNLKLLRQIKEDDRLAQIQ